MSITLNDIINYGSCRFKVVKFATSEDIGQIQNALSSIKTNPPGTIISFAGNSTPDGYLLCDGSAISRTTYDDLFDAIGTTYGTGDEETTFNIPNLTSGEFLESSTIVGTTHAAGLPNISGTLSYIAGKHSTNTSGSASTMSQSGALISTYKGCYNISNQAYYLGSYTVSINASSSSSIYKDNCTTVQPKSLTVRFVIKY